MSANTTFRRSSAALGAAGILALSFAGPALAREDPSTGELPRCTSGCYEGPQPTQVVPVHDNSIEYAQLGGGVLIGMAVAGAGVALAARHSHRSVARAA